MARPLWTGVMSFGLVNVPVRLESAARSERPHFHLLHAKDESPVHFARICAHDGKVVPWSEIAKGYEVKKGELAVLTQEDFKRAALDRSETMDILAFVPNGAIDARYFETPYYLTPGKGGGRAYGLLREAMREANRVAVAQIVMRQSQHIGAITPVGDALVLTTLRFANEVAEIPALEGPRTSALPKNELALARKLVEEFTADWKPAQYRDRYSENLRAIIKAKTKKHAEPKLEDLGPAAPRAAVSDLMEKLRASLARGPHAAAPAQAAAPAASKRGASSPRKRVPLRRHRRAA